MSQVIRFPYYQFQVIQFRPRKQIHLRQRKVIHLRPQKEYLAIQLRLTEGVFCHLVPSTDADPLTSTEDRSQMNCASISNTADSSDSSPKHVVGSKFQSLSITDLPFTQDKVESTYADVFQDLGKFPGEPYKLRLKPDAVPAKAQTKKSSCTPTRCIP